MLGTVVVVVALTIPIDDDWQEHAECRRRGVDSFAEDPAGIALALDACRACPVRAECRDLWLEHPVGYGIWAGAHASVWLRRRQLATRVAAVLAAVMIPPASPRRCACGAPITARSPLAKWCAQGCSARRRALSA